MDRPRVARDNPRPMLNRPAFVALALALLTAPLASCQCSRTQQERTTEAPPEPKLVELPLKLANGLDVDLVTGPCGESAAFVVLIHVGIDHDPAGRSGMAQLAGRLLVTSAPPGRPERTVEVGNDYLMMSVVGTEEQVLLEIDDMASRMAQRTPTEADQTREKTRMLEELGKIQGDDAQKTAVQLAEEAVRPSRGNGKRLGIAAEVEAITVGELQTYWQGHIKPGNTRMVIAGKYDTEKVRARLETSFTPLAAGTPPVLRDPGEATVKGTLVMGEKPTAVAIAIPVPAFTDATYAPFLVLASRLLEQPAQPRTWLTQYDPIRRPDVLLVTGPVGQTEQPEPAAGRMRDEMAKILAAPLAATEIATTKERFHWLLKPRELHPDTCAKDARAFAIARARGAQLKMNTSEVTKALESVTKEQLEEAAKLFGAKQSAAVIAGGAIR